MMKPKRRKLPAERKAEPARLVTVRRERNLGVKISAAAVRRAVRRTLAQRSFRGAAAVTVLLAGDATLAELNARYRGIPRPTDVLSFSSRLADPETGIRLLGDVVISLPRASQQAAARKATVESEVLLLAVHGTLHLLGLDHADPEGKKGMWKAQREILKEISPDAK
jgi:probable rRNA maturation factor